MVIPWVEVRGVAKYPTVPTTSPHVKELSSPRYQGVGKCQWLGNPGLDCC